MYSEVCLELAKAGEGLTKLEGGHGGREMVVLCLTLSWLGKRKESKGLHPALLFMQDLICRTGEQPQGWRKANNHVYSSETSSRNIYRSSKS